MSGNSRVPSTCEWLARICSSSVEPDLGKPTMKIGSDDWQPAPARSAKNTALYISCSQPADESSVHIRLVQYSTAPQRVAARVVFERRAVFARVLEGFSQREIQL